MPIPLKWLIISLTSSGEPITKMGNWTPLDDPAVLILIHDANEDFDDSNRSLGGAGRLSSWAVSGGGGQGSFLSEDIRLMAFSYLDLFY